MGINPYRYVFNNPFNVFDPTGLAGVPKGYRPYTKIVDGAVGGILTPILPMVDRNGNQILEMPATTHDGAVGPYYVAPIGYHYDGKINKYIYGLSFKER